MFLKCVQTFEPTEFKNKIEVSSTFPTLRDRLEETLKSLNLTATQLAAELRISPEWLSKIMNRKAQGSDDIGLRLNEFLRRRGIEPTSIPRLELAPAVHVAPEKEQNSVESLEEQIRAVPDTLILAAKKDPARLGWILGQMKEHLALPRHWRRQDEVNSGVAFDAAKEVAERYHGVPARRPQERHIEDSA